MLYLVAWVRLQPRGHRSNIILYRVDLSWSPQAHNLHVSQSECGLHMQLAVKLRSLSLWYSGRVCIIDASVFIHVFNYTVACIKTSLIMTCTSSPHCFIYYLYWRICTTMLVFGLGLCGEVCRPNAMSKGFYSWQVIKLWGLGEYRLVIVTSKLRPQSYYTQ